MPPKVKITKEEIINAAVALVRAGGADSLNARMIAAALDYSTQPVFSSFSGMEEVRLAVVERADHLCGEYIRRETESGKYPAYKASGMAYIRFVKEEKELFKLLYMRDRSNEAIPESSRLGDEMEAIVQSNTGLDAEEAKLFHLEMWAYVHGVAVMFSTGFLNLDWELVSKMLTDAYRGLRAQYERED